MKFHNGRELVAGGIKYSLERTVNPKTQSPGQGFFTMIKGFDDMAAGKTEQLEGVQVVDDHTIKFELKQPDATFLHVLAMNFAFAVPKEEIDKWGPDFGKHPVGTGAFMMKEWKLGQRLVLERNKQYHKPGLPHLDQIVFEFGQEPTVALMRLQRGEVDILGDGIPPARFVSIMKDPNTRKLVVEGGQLHTGYVTMNVRMKPFDNVKVRKAVNMAINKERICKIINNRAIPANQPLPPAAEGTHSAVTPTGVGGNLDVRDLSVGTELFLPVAVPGALFSIGDGHAAQGDGEVCGTAIECPLKATVKLELVKGANYRFPRFITSGPVSRHFDGSGYYVTTGIGPDLMEAARVAVGDMVDLVASKHHMRPVEAYMLCSVCADLRISEIVDVPHWVVSYYFPRVVFES